MFGWLSGIRVQGQLVAVSLPMVLDQLNTAQSSCTETVQTSKIARDPVQKYARGGCIALSEPLPSLGYLGLVPLVLPKVMQQTKSSSA